MAAIIIVALNARAQTIPTPQLQDIDNTVDLAVAVDNVLQPLNKSSITTNLLYDRGWKLGDLEGFEGSQNSDTLKSHKEWLRQYGSLVTAYIGTGTSSAAPAINTWKAARDAAEASGKNPLVGMHINYHRFITDSVQLSNLIYELNGQLHDYPNQSTSPYEQRRAFSFSPYITTLYDSLSITYKTSPAFFKTNYPWPVSAFEVDFGNGSGYQNVGINSELTVNYSTFGKKTLRLKVTYTNGHSFFANSTLQLVQTQNYTIPGAKYNSFRDDEIYVAHPDPAEVDHGAKLQIAYGCGHSKLIKPYIYVEGFNPEEFGPNQTYENWYRRHLRYQQEDFPDDYKLMDELSENGYDIVYVDFDKNTGDLMKNAETLAEVIKRVNEMKAANNSSEPNMVVGYSMGGLIARLGIRYLELDGIDPQVSYYISVDSPHLGANLPYAVALAVADLNSITFGGKSLGEYEEKLELAYQVLLSPAARQMLIYGRDSYAPFTFNNSSRVNFQNHLNAMGLPTTTIENVAIAKGNGVGAGQVFGPMADLIEVDIQNNYSCFDDLVDIYNLVDLEYQDPSLIESATEFALNFWLGSLIEAITFVGGRADVDINVNAMPATVDYFLELYYRRIQFRVLWIIPVNSSSRQIKIKNAIPFDSSPGGTYSLNNFSLTGGDLQPLVDGDYAPCIQLFQTDFCFIPTVSALNLQNQFTTPYSVIDIPTAIANDETPFDKAFVLNPALYSPGTAPVNESHLALSPSNVTPFQNYVSPAYSPLSGIGLISSTSINFGSNDSDPDNVIATNDRIVNSVSLEGTSGTQGQLCVNCAGHISILNDTSFPINTAGAFSVELSRNCFLENSILSINEHGHLQIGEDNSKTGLLTIREGTRVELNDGIIEVRENSKLIIDAGAELRLNSGLVKVYDGGEIIVKEGGLLIYEDGVVLELNGNDAQLALGGHTHIGDDATFQFSWQGTEGGYVRILEEGYWGQRFSAGTNARVRLQGTGKDDLILHMEASADFWEFSADETVDSHPSLSSNRFERVTIQNGKVLMEKSSRIVLLRDGRIFGVHLEKEGPGPSPDGLEPLDHCQVLNSDFYGIPIG